MKRTYGIREKLLLFGSIFLIMYGLFLIFHILMDMTGHDYPDGHFLFFPEDRFKDFTNINRAVENMNPYISGLSNYPPLILVMASFFSRMGDYTSYDMNNLQSAIQDKPIWHSFLLFVIIYVVAMMVICIGYFAHRMKITTKGEKLPASVLTGMILLMSAPSVFAIDRGNYILFAIIFFVLWAILEHEAPESMAGPVFAALCAGVKIYPIYVCVMYLFDRKWKKLFVCVGSFAATILLPLVFFKGSYIENLREFVSSALGFGDGSSFYFLYFNVGITGLGGYLFRMLGLHPLTELIHCAWLCAGIGLTLIAGLLMAEEKAIWKKLLIVSALMVFLTPNAYLYCSAFMLGPILIMLVGGGRFEGKDIPYVVLSALLLVPKAYHYLPDMTEAGIPLEYNTLSCAVLFDGLLYFAIIVYYLTEKIAADVVKHKRAKQSNEAKTVG